MELIVSILLGGMVGWIITQYYYKKSNESNILLFKKVDSLLSKISDLSTKQEKEDKYNELNLDTIKIRKEIQDIKTQKVIDDKIFEFNLGTTKSEITARVIISSIPKSDNGFSEYYLTVFIPDQEPFVLKKIVGYEIKCDAQDLDNDGVIELIITYYCGAHSMGLDIYKIYYGLKPKLISLENMGSDYPSIEWKDLDNDGKFEIKIRQRDWENVPFRDYFEYIYKFIDGEIKLISEERFIFEED